MADNHIEMLSWAIWATYRSILDIRFNHDEQCLHYSVACKDGWKMGTANSIYSAQWNAWCEWKRNPRYI